MANSKQKFIALCLCAGVITGCASVKVVPNPAEGDTGVRFYRPKPYLLVTPADPTGRLVNMKLEYLPDFNEEYSAHVRGKASVALKDGWNLVGVNTKEAPKDKEEPPAKIEDIKMPPAVVAATNVPIGYYESVYGFNAANGGKKFLQGWRYIGMTVLGGGQPGVCRVAGHTPNCPSGGGAGGGAGGAANGCINGPLYGLVFFNGVMTFRQLDEIANNQLCPMFVNPAPAPSVPVLPSDDRKPIQEEVITPRKPDVQKESAPPVPSPTTPPAPGSARLGKPAAGLALSGPALARPSASPAPPLPAVASAPAGRPAPLPPFGGQVPVYKKLAAPTPASSNAVASTAPTSLRATRKVVTPTTTARDPAKGSSSSLDSELFRTGTSPRP